METQLIEAFKELTMAHNRVADNLGRLATCFEIKPDDRPIQDHKYVFGDELLQKANEIAMSIGELSENLAKPEDQD